MEIQKVKPSQSERKLLSDFVGEDCPTEVDFNWLMPVVKKIADMVINKDWDNCLEAVKRWKPLANSLEAVDDIEIVFPKVVQFIQWFNKTK